MHDAGASGHAKDEAHQDSRYCQQESFAQDHPHHIRLGSAKRFQDSDLPRALHHCGVHRLKDHNEADHHGNADHNPYKNRKSGNIIGGHDGQPFADGHHVVIFHAGNGFDLLRNQYVIMGIVELHIKNGRLILHADQLLQRFDGDITAGAAAVRDYAADAKFMVQRFYFRAYVHLAAGGQVVIHDHVIRPLERPAFQVTHGAAELFKRLDIDSVEDLNVVGGLHHHRSHGCDVGLLADEVADL